MAVPKYDAMFEAVLQALKSLGGSATISELDSAVAEILKLTEKDLSTIHRGNQTKFSYNLAWARTYLKNAGYIENSDRGIWTLTNKGEIDDKINPAEIKRILKSKSTAKNLNSSNSETEDEPWENLLLEEIKSLSPKAFERLSQRLLRESGFVQVEVTGKSGDGGIDGKGVVRLNLLSFHVHFQCKRYKDSVTAEKVRDFRGAMVGRSDKGLLITTGRFTSEARKEASRDGAPPLELIDGQDLVEMMKNYRLGVKIKMVESVEVDKIWFDEFNKSHS